MKLNLKKAIPILTSALLVGSSFAAAAISSVDQWKSFGTDTVIVYGSDGMAEDSAAAGILGMALQAALTGATTTSVTGEAHLIEAPGNDLNYGESFADVEVALDSSDLPTLLADGKYRESRGKTENEETYTQTLKFTDGTNTIIFDSEDTGDEITDTYLYLADGTAAYTYTLEFNNPIKYDTTDIDKDFELTKVKMLGREYTIVDAKDDSGDGVVDELVFMAGAVKASQWEYSKQTYTLGNKTYEVEVKIISDSDSTAILVINGEETDEMGEGDTYTLEDGTRVGVVDIVPNEGAEKSTGTSEGNDLVTFYLGAEKIVFEDDQEVEINGVDIDNTEVQIPQKAEGEKEGQLTKWTLTAAPEDDTYLATGEAWTDPVLGRFKYTFQGLDKKTEEIKADVSGSTGTVTFKNNAKKDVKVSVIMDKTNNIIYPGDKWMNKDIGGNAESDVYTSQDGGTTFVEGGANLLWHDGDVCAIDSDGANVDLTDCKGVKMLVVASGGELRVLEVKKIEDVDKDGWDGDDDKVTLEDDYGNSWTILADGKAHALGSFAEIKLTISSNKYNPDGNDGDTDPALEATDINTFTPKNNVGKPSWQTSLAGEMAIDFDGNEVNFYVFENDGTNLVGGTDIAWEYDDDTTSGDDLVINADPAAKLTWLPEKEGSDIEKALDKNNYGAIFTWDSDNRDSLTLEYPEEKVIAKAYVSEELATIPELSGVAGTGAVLGDVIFADTELTSELKAKNLIIIGGTAVNRVAAEALDLPYPTYGSSEAWQTATGVTGEGQAILKLLDNPYTAGKQALLVAGWSGSDTTKAARALKENIPGIAGKASVKLDTSSATAVVAE
ncbi:MAG: hypothetical protein QXS07_02100 [Candidatus Pacearchaeota archaeon]